MKSTIDHPGTRRSPVYKAPRRLLFLISSLTAALASCAPSPPQHDLTDLRHRGAGANATRPAALINDQPVEWQDLQPALAEAAGGIVLEEAALDRLVAAEYSSRLGKSPDQITNDRIATERQYFADTIRRASGASADQAAVLAANLRNSKGLGDSRFTALLKRNAMMREIVAPAVSITPDLMQQRFDVRFGPRFRIRIITTATEAEAAAALGQLHDGEGPLAVRFAALAARTSTDESSVRGGGIEPISPADPAYSPALRAALARLTPGQTSGVLALDPGYGIALLEEVVPATATTLDQQRADVEDELRRRQERVLMDTLARGLLLKARITPMHPSLGWSWRNRRTEPQP